MSSIRQQQFNNVIQRELSAIFQKQGFAIWKNALVTITSVVVTPDLSIARAYLSIYNTKEKEAVLEELQNHTNEIRNLLGKALRNHLRRIPELEFFLDDTLDEVFKMEQIFKDLKDTGKSSKSSS